MAHNFSSKELHERQVDLPESDDALLDKLSKPRTSHEQDDARAEEIGEIIAKTTTESLENEVGKIFEVYVDGESDEHEYLLSARKTI